MITFVTIVLAQLAVYFIAGWFGRRAFRKEIDRIRRQSDLNIRYNDYVQNIIKNPPPPTPILTHQQAVDLMEEKVKQEPYRRKLSKSEIEFNKRLMDDFIEKFPNSPFHDQHPEFMEDYLKRVDISELGFGSKK